MIFKTRPTHQKRIPIRLLDAFLKLERLETRHRADDVLGFGKSALKVCFLARDDVEDREFQDHLGMVFQLTFMWSQRNATARRIDVAAVAASSDQPTTRS